MGYQADPELLHRIPLFKGITVPDLDFLAKHLCRRPFKDGDIVMREDEEADAFFVVTAGSLTVQRNGTTLCERRSYEVIGEQALIDETARSATLIARGRVELLEMDRTVFEKMLQCSPQFARNLLGILSDKLREATGERGVRYGREERLQEMFGQHLSREKLDELLLAPDLDTYLAPQRVEATVLFSDIRGFTTASEDLDPTDLADQLNAYLSSVINSVFEHRGLVDRFIGDAVLAVFGIPNEKDDDAEGAIRCALEMVQNAPSYTIGSQQIKIGIGIHTGTVFYGHLGNERKRQLTIMGDVVNTAARLEEKTKDYEFDILVAESTVQKLNGKFSFQHVGHEPFRGKSTETSFYTVAPHHEIGV